MQLSAQQLSYKNLLSNRRTVGPQSRRESVRLFDRICNSTIPSAESGLRHSIGWKELPDPRSVDCTRTVSLNPRSSCQQVWFWLTGKSMCLNRGNGATFMRFCFSSWKWIESGIVLTWQGLSLWSNSFNMANGTKHITHHLLEGIAESGRFPLRESIYGMNIQKLPNLFPCISSWFAELKEKAVNACQSKTVLT